MAVGDTYVFPGFLSPVLTQLSFKNHQLLFSHASAEVRGENMRERKSASTGYRIHNHQIMSSTHSPQGHPDEAKPRRKQAKDSREAIVSYLSSFVPFFFGCGDLVGLAPGVAKAAATAAAWADDVIKPYSLAIFLRRSLSFNRNLYFST